ncbi:anti-sigma B factor RsbW [Brevibacillus massiliensis]|jgi:serine/threonine-protein kinase RsbW|uniref:anti-sigma B factor RsbW n=1 Tax=Brevibacillus massiliensis TaxID=1118054 RepID=UPI0003081BA2|nr:anti-sigma B factor RsbW [Brevibacillus massiliensis]
MGEKRDGDKIELTFPARTDYIGVARLMVSGVANRLGFSYEDIEDIKLAVAEACTNAVRHAYQEEHIGQVLIQCLVRQDCLEIIVADQGSSFDLEGMKAKLGPIDKHRDIADLTEGGLGLYLIHSLMDKVEISENQGVVVAMTKYVVRDGEAKGVDEITSNRNQ